MQMIKDLFHLKHHLKLNSTNIGVDVRQLDVRLLDVRLVDVRHQMSDVRR